jgi:predicted signal transduction protein with EAL and GGDEF domain
MRLYTNTGLEQLAQYAKCTPDQARERLEELSRRLAAQPLEVEHAPARLTLSSGLVDCAIVNWDVSQAIVQADAAARRAKTTGRNRTVLVDGAQLDEVQARLQVAQQLDNATRYELINPHGQPIVDLRSGAPIGIRIISNY